MSNGKMRTRRARIAVATEQRDAIFERAKELGVESVETLIAAKVPSPHWRFFKRGVLLMHYWPATEQYHMLSDGATGKRPLADLVAFLEAEVRDLQGVV